MLKNRRFHVNIIGKGETRTVNYTGKAVRVK